MAQITDDQRSYAASTFPALAVYFDALADAINDLADGSISTTTVTTDDLTVNDDAAITGDATVGGTLGVTGDVQLEAELLISDGSSHYAIIDVASLAANRTFTIPETLGAAEFVMTAGAQAITGTKTFSTVISTTITTAALTATSGAVIGAATANAAGGLRDWTAKLTGVADNTATTLFEVTVPNANHAAAIELTFIASVNNFHSSRVAKGLVVVSRDADDDTVAVVAALALEQIATGGTETLTLAYSVTAMTGDPNAEQTFNIQVTLNTSNSSAAQVVANARILNSEATGITMGTP